MFGDSEHVVAATTTEDDSTLLQSNWDDSDGYYVFRRGDKLQNGRYEVFGIAGSGVFSSVLNIRDVDNPDKEFVVKMIRNNGLANFFDRCALTIPCHVPGEAPVGLMLFGETMADWRLLSIGKAVEAALKSARN